MIDDRDRRPAGRPDRLTAELRAAVPEPPVDAVDWDALHARIVAAATPLLRPRPVASWWQFMAGWAPHALPAGTAAAALIALLIVGAGARTAPNAAAAEATGFRTIEEELIESFAYGTGPLLVAGLGNGELLDAALFYETGEW